MERIEITNYEAIRGATTQGCQACGAVPRSGNGWLATTRADRRADSPDERELLVWCRSCVAAGLVRGEPAVWTLTPEPGRWKTPYRPPRPRSVSPGYRGRPMDHGIKTL